MPDQTAQHIVSELVRMFSAMGILEIVHSDQGRNFESALLQRTLEVFGASKSHTIAIILMVEQFNCTLLQIFRCYVDTKEDWGKYLPLVLYAYHTAVHSSTGTSPFMLMFGKIPKTTLFAKESCFCSRHPIKHILVPNWQK